MISCFECSSFPLNAIINMNYKSEYELQILNINYKIVNKCLLAGNKFMPEMHLKQRGFTYNACGPFTKNKIQNFWKTRDTKYIYRNELDKACFQHDMTYKKFKDLTKRTTSDKLLKDKACNIACNKPKTWWISKMSCFYAF